MKLPIIISLLFNICTATDIPLSWTKETASIKVDQGQSDIYFTGKEKINKIITTHTNLVDRLSYKYPRLDRLDIGLGVSKSGSIGIFSSGKSKSIEMIWQRKKRKTKPAGTKTIDHNIELSPLYSDRDIAKLMEENLRSIISFKSIKRRVKRRILRTLYRDAAKISKIVKGLYKTPQIGNWYINAFWKNYYFSSSFGIMDTIKVGYDKRIRFRFKIKKNEYRYKTNIDNSTVVSMMKMFNKIQANESKDNSFKFYRVRASLDVSLSFNLLMFSKSVGKGVLVEFKRSKKEVNVFTQNNKTRFINKTISIVTNKLNNHIDKIDLRSPHFPLNQVRYNFELSSELDFSLVSLEKEKSISFHFKRLNRETKVEKESFKLLEKKDLVKKRSKKINELIKLKQIDYRHRASFSFKIPFIKRVRIRPSYEYRYGVR